MVKVKGSGLPRVFPNLTRMKNGTFELNKESYSTMFFSNFKENNRCFKKKEWLREKSKTILFFIKNKDDSYWSSFILIIVFFNPPCFPWNRNRYNIALVKMDYVGNFSHVSNNETRLRNRPCLLFLNHFYCAIISVFYLNYTS